MLGRIPVFCIKLQAFGDLGPLETAGGARGSLERLGDFGFWPLFGWMAGLGSGARLVESRAAFAALF